MVKGVPTTVDYCLVRDDEFPLEESGEDTIVH